VLLAAATIAIVTLLLLWVGYRSWWSPVSRYGFYKATGGPLKYYCVVVDQNDQPVSGVSVHGHVDAAGGRQRLVEATTDSAGRFSLETRGGGRAAIDDLIKPGYSRWHHYAHISDRLKPGDPGTTPETAIKLGVWKHDPTPNPLFVYRRALLFEADGSWRAIDLIAGKIVTDDQANRDAQIRVTRQKDTDQRGRFSWQVELKAINGGFFCPPESDRPNYLAPEHGYEQTLEWGYTSKAEPWADSVSGAEFYVRLRNGKAYGRVKIQIKPKFGVNESARAWVDLEVVVSPISTRQLEPTANGRNGFGNPGAIRKLKQYFTDHNLTASIPQDIVESIEAGEYP